MPHRGSYGAKRARAGLREGGEQPFQPEPDNGDPRGIQIAETDFARGRRPRPGESGGGFGVRLRRLQPPKEPCDRNGPARLATPASSRLKSRSPDHAPRDATPATDFGRQNAFGSRHGLGFLNLPAFTVNDARLGAERAKREDGMPDSPSTPYRETDRPSQRGPARLLVVTRQPAAWRSPDDGSSRARLDIRTVAPEDCHSRTGSLSDRLDDVSAVLVDLEDGDPLGLEAGRRLTEDGCRRLLFVATDRPAIALVTRAMRVGARDVLVKPVSYDRLVHALAATGAIPGLAGELAWACGLDDAGAGRGRKGLDRLRGRSPALEALRRLARRAACTPAPVFLEGAPGVGKTVLARAIHEESARRAGPFLVLRCDAYDEEELSRRLFAGRLPEASGPGILERARGGTVCLKEIGALPPALQSRLLATLEDGAVQDAAGSARAVDVRLIVTSTRPAEALRRTGQLREDLFYRLCAVPLRVPSLADRREDIALLAQDILARLAETAGAPPRALAADALRMLETADWPGNIRQLENLLIRACLLAPAERSILQTADLLASGARGPEIDERTPAGQAGANGEAGPVISLVDEQGEVKPWHRLEREIIARALTLTDGEMTRCARALRIGRSTLYRKVAAYRLARPRPSRTRP